MNKLYQWTDDLTNVTFTTPAEAALEYSFGVWAKWLNEFPSQLTHRATLHSLARMATTQGDDLSTLAVFAGIGRWVFETYDLSDPKIQNSVPYDGQLEGQWYFVSFSFKRDLPESEAVGYVYSSWSKSIHRLAFKVQHLLMSGYCYFVIAEKKLSYLPFHG